MLTTLFLMGGCLILSYIKLMGEVFKNVSIVRFYHFFTKRYISIEISIATDGASIMVGERGGDKGRNENLYGENVKMHPKLAKIWNFLKQIFKKRWWKWIDSVFNLQKFASGSVDTGRALKGNPEKVSNFNQKSEIHTCACVLIRAKFIEMLLNIWHSDVNILKY